MHRLVLCLCRRSLVLFLAGLLGGLSAGFADTAAPQDPPPDEAGAATEPSAPDEAGEPAGATGTRITVHGYLSQAYAQSDGNEIAGITEDGTGEYRTAAIQIRADVTPRDTFAIQLSHELLGASDIQQFREDVELDWVFYERRFENSAIKVGRVQIPFGIYNEVRDVGTLLPFYRPSTNFYGDGSFSSETVDGIVLSHTFGLGGGWRLEGDLHYGNWDFVSRSQGFSEKEVENSIGVELWLETPIEGLRVGAGAIDYEIADPGGNESWETYHFSLDGAFGRVLAQLEYKYIGFVGGDYDGGYARLGVNVTDRVQLNAQVDYSDLAIDGFREGNFDDDYALGLAYAFRSDLVLKAEHHWNEGFTPEHPAQNFFAPPLETDYFIVSLSTSF